MGVSNNITTLYGWSEQGERAYAEQAGFATERVNIVAGYNAGTKELITPLEHSGYMDKQLFSVLTKRTFFANKLNCSDNYI